MTSAPSASATATPAAAAGAVAFDDPEFEHGDPVSFVCLLCQRQFKSVPELRKHNDKSQLHKAHLLAKSTPSIHQR